MELTSQHQWKNSGKVKRRCHASCYLPDLSRWHPSQLSDACLTRRTLNQTDWPKATWKLSHHHETLDCEPCGRAVLLCSLPLLLSTRAPLPYKVSCFVSTRVYSDNSFLSVRQMLPLGPWKGSSFLQCTLEFPSSTNCWVRARRHCFKQIVVPSDE